MKRALIKLFLTILLTTSAQVTFAQFAEPWLEMGTDGKGYHLFQINPAALPTNKSKADLVMGRHSKENKMEQSGNNPTTLSNETTETLIGVAAMGDLGAGASAGLSYTKISNTSTSKSSTANSAAEEHLDTQTFSGRMVIELTQELAFALNMRYLYETADMQGSFNTNSSQRIAYKGTLVGYATGIKYAVKDYSIGGAYYPPARGKAEIISEDKLITEPGLTLLEGSYEKNKYVFGASYLRWLYRRDERAPTTTSEDGNRTLSVTGLDFDRFLFPISTILLGLDYKFDQKSALRLSFARHTDVFEFDTSANPGDNSGSNEVNYNKIKGAIRVSANRVDIQVGFGVYSRSSSVSGQNSGNYTASGRELFAELHSEF